MMGCLEPPTTGFTLSVGAMHYKRAHNELGSGLGTRSLHSLSFLEALVPSTAHRWAITHLLAPPPIPLRAGEAGLVSPAFCPPPPAPTQRLAHDV